MDEKDHNSTEDETTLISDGAKDDVQSTILSKLDDLNSISNNIPNESAKDDSESIQDDNSRPTSEFYNVLRSERPLNSMGMYTKYELHEIVPENVVAAFRSEKNKRFRQLKRESKHTKGPSNTDTRLVKAKFF